MSLISNWILCALLIISVLTASSSAIVMSATNQTPICKDDGPCYSNYKFCSKLNLNGNTIFKGCGEVLPGAGDLFVDGDKCIVKTKEEWDNLGNGRKSVEQLELERELRAMLPNDKFEVCLCDSDKCNSGTAPSISGFMFGSSLVIFFLARRMYGF